MKLPGVCLWLHCGSEFAGLPKNESLSRLFSHISESHSGKIWATCMIDMVMTEVHHTVLLCLVTKVVCTYDVSIGCFGMVLYLVRVITHLIKNSESLW